MSVVYEERTHFHVFQVVQAILSHSELVSYRRSGVTVRPAAIAIPMAGIVAWVGTHTECVVSHFAVDVNVDSSIGGHPREKHISRSVRNRKLSSVALPIKTKQSGLCARITHMTNLTLEQFGMHAPDQRLRLNTAGCHWASRMSLHQPTPRSRQNHLCKS